jgi:hypothetical protein
VKTVLSGGMLVVGSGAVATAHSFGSSTTGVTAFEHSASASKISAVASGTEGTTSTLAFIGGSSVGVTCHTPKFQILECD